MKMEWLTTTIMRYTVNFRTFPEFDNATIAITMKFFIWGCKVWLWLFSFGYLESILRNCDW